MLVSPLIALYLGYIDEGAYSFAYLWHWDAPIFLALYSWGPLLGLFIMARAFRRVRNEWLKHLYTLTIGLVLGALIEASFFYSIYLLVQLFMPK